MPAKQNEPAYSYMPPTSRGSGILTKKPLKMGKYMQNLKEIRCQCCNKLLAKVGTVKRLEIKCSRCKTINHIN